MAKRVTPWTDEEDAKVISLRAKGLVIEQISEQVGRSKSAVQRRMLRLGLRRYNSVGNSALARETPIGKDDWEDKARIGSARLLAALQPLIERMAA